MTPPRRIIGQWYHDSSAGVVHKVISKKKSGNINYYTSIAYDRYNPFGAEGNRIEEFEIGYQLIPIDEERADGLKSRYLKLYNNSK